MKTFYIKSLETGGILAEMEADSFTVTEEGIVLFFGSYEETTRKRSTIGTTQVSGSILIYEKQTPVPALVIPIK